MTIPKEDERTPGRQPIDNDLLDVMANAAWEKLGMVGMEEVRVAIELMLNAAWFEGYQLRSDAMVENTTRKLAESVNAYTSTDALRSALAKLLTTAQLLLQNAEGCAVNHHGADFQEFGPPGWLADCENDIVSARTALAVGSKTPPEPLLDECDELARMLLGGSEPLMQPLSVRSHLHDASATLSTSTEVETSEREMYRAKGLCEPKRTYDPLSRDYDDEIAE